MADMQKERARAAYEAFAKGLEAMDWKFSRKDEDMVIKCGARGDDLPIDLFIKMFERLQLVQVFSPLPFTVKEDKRLDMAVAMAAVNNKIVDGCFELDISDGTALFRMTYRYPDELPNAEVVQYLMLCTCQTVDEYNDKFLMLAKGMLSLEQFIAAENKD